MGRPRRDLSGPVRGFEVGQTQGPFLVDITQAGKIQERPESGSVPRGGGTVRAAGPVMNADAVVGEGEVGDFRGRAGHVAMDAAVRRALLVAPRLAHGAALGLVTTQANGIVGRFQLVGGRSV